MGQSHVSGPGRGSLGCCHVRSSAHGVSPAVVSPCHSVRCHALQQGHNGRAPYLPPGAGAAPVSGGIRGRRTWRELCVPPGDPAARMMRRALRALRGERPGGGWGLLPAGGCVPVPGGCWGLRSRHLSFCCRAPLRALWLHPLPALRGAAGAAQPSCSSPMGQGPTSIPCPARGPHCCAGTGPSLPLWSSQWRRSGGKAPSPHPTDCPLATTAQDGR